MAKHWVDEVAEGILASRGKDLIVAAGVTPSGEIHLGNLKEILIGDAVRRSLRRMGARARFVLVADTFDGLRRLYPFLPESFKEFVGKPLSEIPDPEGCCESYARHFLGRFIRSAKEIGVEPDVQEADRMYKEGRYTEAIDESLLKRDELAEIIGEISGRAVPPEWSPYNPLCPACGTITTKNITSTNVNEHWVEFTCPCGHSGRSHYDRGEGKLVWRVDWPARWQILGVTFEPYGKDHATQGGSYDTGKVISERIFNYPAPEPMVYEWVLLKGEGTMSSSKGIVLTLTDLLEAVPPPIVRYIILKPLPGKHLTFDPGMALINIMDEFSRLSDSYIKGELDEVSARLFELSAPEELRPPKPILLTFKHCLTLVQIANYDFHKFLEVIGRGEYRDDLSQPDQLGNLFTYCRNWLENFAPSEVKFQLKENLPIHPGALSSDAKKGLSSLYSRLTDRDVSLASPTGEELHNLIYNVSVQEGIKAKELFETIYLIFLGKSSGPRAGWFLASLPRDFVLTRISQAVSEEKRSL